MTLFGFEITVRKQALPPLRPFSGREGGWWPIVREPFTGAWQMNQEQTGTTPLSYWAVFACVTLIASDIGKLRLGLMTQSAEGQWTDAKNPAYSPVLRKPNRYQTAIKFVEQWITSKLVHGNTYVLKERDLRGVVVALYVLDPRRVTPLIAPDGSVYYRLERDDLAGLAPAGADPGLTVPAREIIHDLMIPLFHPLIGVTPLYACGLSALQGQTIQANSSKFFATGSNPGGVLTAPGAIAQDTALRLKDYWETNFTGANVGKVAVLGDGLKYEPMSVNAVDSQLIEQLGWSAQTIAGTYHVPYVLIDSSHGIPYANAEPLLNLYYSQCLQSLIVSFEASLDEGLGILEPVHGTQYGTALDIDDLIWMDTATRTKAAAESIGSGGMAPDEARARYFGLGPVPGGASPYLQQQYFSLAALAERDAAEPFTKPAPATPPPDDTFEELAFAELIDKQLAELEAVA
jgi:HK97 family phage portal protein